MYANGQGVPQNYAEAVKWYRLAADQGNATAQFNLALMYANGQGVPQNYAEAVKWYRLAADQGDAEAQNQPRASVRLWQWRNAGLRYGAHVVQPVGGAGGREAVKSREAVARRMTSAQIAEAQKLAREWKPK